MYKELFGKQKSIEPVQREARDLAERNPWKDALTYESYMPELSGEYARNAMRKIFEPAVVSNEEFNEEELSWLYAFAFGCCNNVRHNANGTMFVSGHHDLIVTKFADKLERILPGCTKSPQIAGNFFITPSQYGLHNDSTRRADWESSMVKAPVDSPLRRYVPWRNIIIPMWIAYPQVVSHGVWFDQRHLDFAHVYNHGQKVPPPATTYPVVTDHSTIDFYNQKGELLSKEQSAKTYDAEHFGKYLWHTPRARLTGLTPESTIEWIPGKPIIFDAVQLHATNPGTNLKSDVLGATHEVWNSKMGLLLTFLKEIE
jgi:hypothetical protein